MKSRARLLLDSTHTYLRPEMATGIQRVVRQVAARCDSCSPGGISCTPIYHHRGGWHDASGPETVKNLARLRLRRQSLRSRRKETADRSFPASILGAAGCRLAEMGVSLQIFLRKAALARASKPVTPIAGDTLVLMEYPDAERRELIVRAKAAGVRIVAVVYDLIPLRFPGYFNDPSPWIDWFDWISRNADRVVTISQAVEREFADAYPHAADKLGYFHLGGDFAPPAHIAESPIPPGYFLMVGTLEPRKGHQVALDAFERLWSAGRDVSLVIVGRPGWLTDGLMARIRGHAELGRRLVWLEDADDAVLEAAYRGAHALIAASEAEGFGLPLVEAMLRGVPVLASDIPVFREVGGRWAHYFTQGDPGALADLVASRATEPRPDLSGFGWISWDESARRFLLVAAGLD